ncbi:MAG TPA: tetratricopeptide repeat protein, partial [Saprospiraceae bacterium]|nr:tetratricopeptide repeat protein [Saprospiraceae bacterium]
MNRSLILIAAFLCFLGMSSAQSIQDGLKQMENENYTAALQTFSGLAKSDPKNPINQYYIGEVHYALENTTEARKAYEKGLSINSNCDQCHIGLGRLDFDSGKFDEGQKHLDLALKGNSKNAQIQALVGGAYLYGKSPRPDLALPYLEKARDLDPKQAKFWIALGDAYQLKGELGDAMTAYETAVEKDKTDLETYVKMSRIWADGKQLDLAIERLEKAIEIKSDYALAYKNLYELYIRTRRFDKVVPVLDKYVALSGSDVDAKVRLVKFLSFQAKDYERAIAEGKVLVKAHPEEYTLHRWLAWSYYETGAFDSSLSESYALFGKINQ